MAVNPPIVLSPWPARPTFTEATLTAQPHPLSDFRTIAAGSWYSVRNIGTASVSLHEANIIPNPSSVEAVTLAAERVLFIQGRTGTGFWLWGAGARIEVATAAWWFAIVSLGGSVPRVGLQANRLTPDDGEMLDIERANSYGTLASARVERDAPGAPQAIKNEAAIRYVGYLGEAGSGAISQYTIGPKTAEFETKHANAWRNCGAAGLLAPWKVRRAGVIGRCAGRGRSASRSGGNPCRLRMPSSPP